VDTSRFADTFNLVDADKDGFISAAELQRLMEILGDVVTLEHAAQVVGRLDADGDGLISLAEFAGYMGGGGAL
jgi:Ca2+-binding EF-hand superfamily protein